MKAYLLSLDIEPPRTHDLQMLCRLCENQDPSIPAVNTDCADLTKYGVRVRYPFEIEIEQTDVDKALMEAKHIVEIVSEKLRAV